MEIGYIRVSTDDQNPDAQRDALLRASVAAQTGSRRDNPVAQRPLYLAATAVGVLTAIAAATTVLMA